MCNIQTIDMLCMGPACATFKQSIHPCSKVIGIIFAMSIDGIYFQCVDLKFFVLHDEVFCNYCGKYHECMLQRHACVNIQIQ